MAYDKQSWLDEILSEAAKFNITANGRPIATGAQIDMISPVVQQGSPVTAGRMNHIEDGLKEADTNALYAQQYSFDKLTLPRPTAQLGSLATTIWGPNGADYANYWYATVSPGLSLDNSWAADVDKYGTTAQNKLYDYGKGVISAYYNGLIYVAFERQPTASMYIKAKIYRPWTEG